MRYFLTFLLCGIFHFGYAQDIPLKTLMTYINKPVTAIRDSLTVRGWADHAELSGTKANQLYQTFSYGTKKSNPAEALAWFRIHADDHVVNQLYYQLPGMESYTIILNELKAISTEKKEVQTIENNQISSYYLSPDYTFQTIVGGGSYTLMVMTNK